MLHRIRARAVRLLNYLRRDDPERDLREQIDAHTRMLEDDFVGRGMTPAEARIAARRAMGPEALIRQITREQQTIPAVDTLVSDVRLAARRLRRQPAAAVVSILALAGGIAATSVTWSLAAALRHPLPVAGADRLVLVGSGFNASRHAEYTGIRASGVFNAVAGIGRREVPIGRERPHPGVADFASHDFFDLLGLVPALGRDFLPEDDRPGAPLVAMLSEGYWRRAFGSRLDVLGTGVVVSGRPAIVVGVAPRRFAGVDLTEAPDIYLPLHTAEPAELTGSPSGQGTSQPLPWMSIVARLHAGSDPVQAAVRLKASVPDEARSRTLLPVTPLNAAVIARTGIGSSVQFGVVLVATVGLLLAIGCLAAGELLLLRTEARRDELAMCLALGASRGRLVRGIVAEGALLAVSGAVLALPLSVWLLAGIRGFELPGGVQVDRLDLTVDGFALLAAAGAAVAAMFVIALLAGSLVFSLGTHRIRRPHTGATPRVTRAWTRRALGAGQVAISLVLLAGAGLFARSIAALLTVEPGDDVRNILSGTIGPGAYGSSDEETAAFFDALRSRLGGHPAIEAVSIAKPYSNSLGGRIVVDGRPREFPSFIYFQGVDERYFSTLRLPSIVGRHFSTSDRLATAPSVAIVSESLGRLLANGGDAVGRQLGPMFWRPPELGRAQVVGVVPDLVTNLTLRSPYVIYMPIEQMPGPTRRTLFVRAAADPAIAIREVAGMIRAVDPGMPLPAMRTIGDRLDEQMRTQRLGTIAMGGVGLAAALLTALGIYVLAESLAARRRRELAIRAALGASGSRLGVLVLREALMLTGLGVLIGVAVVWAASDAVRMFLFQIEPFDPPSLSAVSLLLFLLFLAVSLKPARAATSMDVARLLAEE